MMNSSVFIPALPIDATLPDIVMGLANSSNLVLEAPPGAGKTTRVPLCLLDEPWLSGQTILMLEPRRLAARAAAQRMAHSLNESVGQTVGYRIRFESKVSTTTRIMVVTEGILTRLLQSNPELDGFGLVIFDEFHERSLHADIGLALCLDCQSAFRPDLRILIMSATLEGDVVAEKLGGAQKIRSEGQSWPVITHYLRRPKHHRDLPQATAAAVIQAAQSDAGDILVFLPGVGEINRTHSLIKDALPDCAIFTLYGEASQSHQDMALRPSQQRKVILSTAIAETSLTFDGVRIVVDSGLMRMSQFDSNAGMSRLVTLPVTRDRADQRRGRAGRQAAGVCWRLWSEAENRAVGLRATAEIMVADLTGLAMELAQWGSDGTDLCWLDTPPAMALKQARVLLNDLGILTEKGRITAHGIAALEIGIHPRLAHMLIKAKEQGLGSLGCDMAALLDSRDPLRHSGEVDIHRRLIALNGEDDHQADSSRLAQIRKMAQELRRRLNVSKESFSQQKMSNSRGQLGALLALAYPDRVAKRRKGVVPRYLLSSGRGVALDELDPLAQENWLVIAWLDGKAKESKVYLAAPILKAEIESLFEEKLIIHNQVVWDKRGQQVQALWQKRFGSISLDEKPLSNIPANEALSAMIDGIRQMGLSCLAWTPALRMWQARLIFAYRHDSLGHWPDVSDDALLENLEEWIAPFLAGCLKREHLEAVDISSALHNLLDWQSQKRLDSLFPSHVTVPSGHQHPIDYGGITPSLSVRLQEMFGCDQTPAILDGQYFLTLKLLSPARRLVQTTQDLAGFWASSYKVVKGELKGRYPKHHWPDNPMEAEATTRIKRTIFP